MAYGGESNAKRVARAEAWNIMLNHVARRKDPEDVYALVLAGPNAGDIRVLRCYGLPAENVTAVDIDPAAIESSRAIVPEADYRVGDVLEIASQHQRGKPPRKYDLIFLDYCSPISERAIRKSVRVARTALINGGSFCTGFMYGREGPGGREGVEVGRKLVQLTKEGLRSGVMEPTPAMLRRLHQNGLTREQYLAVHDLEADTDELSRDQKKAIEQVQNFSARVLFLQKRALECALESGMVLFNTGNIAYRSGRRDDNGHSSGVPMFYYMARGLQFLGHLSRRKLERHYKRAAAEFDANETFYAEYVPDDPDGDRLREKVVDIARAKGSTYASELFNLKRQQVAAWLAWETMRLRSENAEA